MVVSWLLPRRSLLLYVCGLNRQQLTIDRCRPLLFHFVIPRSQTWFRCLIKAAFTRAFFETKTQAWSAQKLNTYLGSLCCASTGRINTVRCCTAQGSQDKRSFGDEIVLRFCRALRWCKWPLRAEGSLKEWKLSGQYLTISSQYLTR